MRVANNTAYSCMFDLLCTMKEKLKCSFEFEFNSKMEVMMICKLPSGYILSGFVIMQTPGGHGEFEAH